MRTIIWSVKDLAKMSKRRILNRFDSNVAVTGGTGLGKSTFLHHFFTSMNSLERDKELKTGNKFDINKHLVFSRIKMIDLIENYKFGYCWNDELISSAYKREFYKPEQNELIKVLTKYRNNFNIVGGAVPIFFSLDKELLKLFGMHINIIRRGIGIVHLPREGRMFTDDIWDIKINSKLEEKWSKKKQKNPSFKIPYHKYTTFAGYVFFPPLKPEQEEYYEELKEELRKERDNVGAGDKKEGFYERVLKLLKSGKMDEDSLLNLCLYEDKKFSSVKVRLNQLLKDEGGEHTLKHYLKDKIKKRESNSIYKNNNPPLKKLNDMDV